MQKKKEKKKERKMREEVIREKEDPSRVRFS